MRLPATIAMLAACSSTSVNTDSPDAGVTVDAPPAAGTCPEGLALGAVANKPTFSVMIDGHGPYTFIYDTGAPASVIDTTLHAQIGSGPYSLTVGGRTLTASSLPDTNLAQAVGIAGVHGIIGTDLLGPFVVTIDRERGRMWLDDTLDEAALAACTHVSSTVTRADFVLANYLYVKGRIEDVDGWYLVDTGATLGAIEQPIFDDLQVRHPRPVLTGFYTQAAIGTFWAELATIGAMEVGAMRVAHITTRTVQPGVLPASPQSPFLGLLPDPFLHHALMTVDYPNHRIRWAPYRDDTLVEPTFVYTAGIGLAAETATPPHIATVLPGSAAAAEGVAVGDTVLQINGTAIASIPLASRPWALTTQGPGSFAITVQGAAGTRTLNLATTDLLTSP